MEPGAGLLTQRIAPAAGRIAVLFLLPFALARPRLPAAAPVETLTVFAAASLTDAFGELGRVFEASHPGTRVRFNFAGSQQLALQLELGARADLFASADRRWMRRVERLGLLAEPARVFARNTLVVVLPRDNPGAVATIGDLARPGLKLVLAADAVPAGRYARESLRALERLPDYPAGFTRRVLGNVVSEEENVRGVVAKVQLGEADAGIAYRSDVTGTAAGRLLTLAFPSGVAVVAGYPIALLKGAAERDAARGFLRLVAGPEGRAVLTRHGFEPADDRP